MYIAQGHAIKKDVHNKFLFDFRGGTATEITVTNVQHLKSEDASGLAAIVVL